MDDDAGEMGRKILHSDGKQHDIKRGTTAVTCLGLSTTSYRTRGLHTRGLDMEFGETNSKLD